METKVRCLRVPENLFLSSLKTHRVVEPTPSTNIRFRTLKPLNINKMESLKNTGLDTKEWKRDKSNATISEEETNAHVCRKRRRHSDDGQTFRKNPLLSGSSRSEKLRSLPPGLARVPPAHFRGRKPARRGCRGRRGTRGLFQRELLIGLQKFDRRHSARGNVPLLSGVRGSTRVISRHAPIVPSRVGNAALRRGAETLMCGAYGQC